MVLLDSTAPQVSPAEAGSASVVSRIAVLMPALGRLGAGRDLGSSFQEFFEGSASTRQASAMTDLNGKPLIVLTAGASHDSRWLPAQQRMATLSTNSLHRVAQGTTHQSLLADEADSAAAVKAILEVVQSVRTSRPLAAE